jgi:large subunit ribosomal protein L21
MYAIVDFAGQQFKVEKDGKFFVHRLEADVDTTVEFEKVMLLEEDGKVQVGVPYVDGCKVTAKILNHLKGDKVTVFKKKRRKGYQKSNGHRQYFTQIIVEDIVTK